VFFLACEHKTNCNTLKNAHTVANTQIQCSNIFCRSHVPRTCSKCLFTPRSDSIGKTI